MTGDGSLFVLNARQSRESDESVVEENIEKEEKEKDLEEEEGEAT